MKRAIVAALAAAIILYVGSVAWNVVNKVKAKETMTHMRRLASLLANEKPKSLSSLYVRELLVRYAVSPTYLSDGWGRPLVFEKVQGAGGVKLYRITSLGRDGRRGSCCKRFLGFAWADDAVIEGEVWLQAW